MPVDCVEGGTGVKVVIKECDSPSVREIEVGQDLANENILDVVCLDLYSFCCLLHRLCRSRSHHQRLSVRHEQHGL